MQTTHVHSPTGIPPRARQRLDAAGARFARQFRDLRRIEWTIRPTGSAQRVHCAVHSRTGVYQASSTGGSVRGAIDTLADVILRQRRRARRRLVAHRRHAGPGAARPGRVAAAGAGT